MAGLKTEGQAMSKKNSSERNGTLNNRQEAVAACLAAGWTVKRSGEECKVGKVTIFSWLKQPAFKERVSELRKELTDRAIGRLADLMAGTATTALEKLLTDAEGITPGVRLESVRTVFEMFLQTTSASEMKDRLEALELNIKVNR